VPTAVTTPRSAARSLGRSPTNATTGTWWRRRGHTPPSTHSTGRSRWASSRTARGTPKPATEPFEAALDALAVAPERTLFVGDSPATDVAGANAAGLVSVLVGERAADPPRPDAMVDSLHDVTDLVG